MRSTKVFFGAAFLSTLFALSCVVWLLWHGTPARGQATLVTTMWYPDTCSCIVEYEWDSALPETARAHTFKRFVRKGPEHAALTDMAAYAALVAENPRKNSVLADAVAGFPGLLDAGGKLQPDISWSYDASRVLTVDFAKRITQGQKNTLQTTINAKFGSGLVVIK